MPPERSGQVAPVADIPRATYRLQLHAGFTFRAATAIVPYLHSLGISHVYCSPYFRARAGSTHGYDVVDHNAFNPEIGSREDFEQFVAALRAHGMGHILDIVPNHVGIMGADNAWWMDVLESGPASVYAEFFDIDWTPANPTLTGKVLVPVLGDRYGVVLERSEIELRYERERGAFAAFYHEHRFPLDPRTYPRVLERVPAQVASAELESLKEACAALPERAALPSELRVERAREIAALKQRLRSLCAREPALLDAIETALRSFAGDPASRASFDALHELLELQAYRLAYWRVASDDINYRRFFDVNDLAALRVENEAVFDATHRLVLELIGAGKLDGLRIDHPDGLYDPAQYFRRLQSRIAALRYPGVEPAPERPLYLVVEKITASFERLPADWPVHGETGYHFANVVNRMLVDGATRARMDRVYRSFVEEARHWADVAYECQHLVLRRSLASELITVANQLARLAQTDRRTRDFTYNTLRQALAEVIACFPVYRTYLSATASPSDRRYVDWSIAAARQRRSAAEAPVFEFVRLALLAELPVPEATRGRMLALAMKFQQVTAPTTAKGIEDTALYRFNRLVSLNEVGGEPDAYGAPLRAFHADAVQRARLWPHEMLATSTHDTKRSEDVRARINVLSEMTAAWRKTLERWSRFNRARKREIEGRPAPSRNDEYLFYQTLIGTWPLEALDADGSAEYQRRIEAYMIKAAREAKVSTSWHAVDAAYEEALSQFVRAALEPREGNLMLADLISVQQRIARFGLLNGLSQLLCKLTVPGVPDIYQGNELWDFSLVDPDNRRPVDYAQRAALLAELREWGEAPAPELAARARALLEHTSDGRIKLYVTWRALELRRRNVGLFSHGEYLALKVTGSRAANVCAFARRRGREVALVAVPRLTLRLLGEDGHAPLGFGVWGDTLIELPPDWPDGMLRSVFDGTTPPVAVFDGPRGVLAAEVFTHFPVGLLSNLAPHTEEPP
jgi:(1->4)-alpha-D-glucan 1-alpha-D-glucosylmutase